MLTSKTQMQALDMSHFNLKAKEKLLIYEDEGGLKLSLYLDQQILDHYVRHDPMESLDENNIQEFCLVLEGISHFLYMVWNASHDRSVTLLEMELQAEVDKFIILLECLERQSNSPAPGQLSRLLFQSNIYHDDLSYEESRRYRQATEYARRYCRHLEHRFLGQGNRTGLLSELRKFYRLNKLGKLGRIGESH